MTMNEDNEVTLMVAMQDGEILSATLSEHWDGKECPFPLGFSHLGNSDYEVEYITLPEKQAYAMVKRHTPKHVYHPSVWTVEQCKAFLAEYDEMAEDLNIASDDLRRWREAAEERFHDEMTVVYIVTFESDGSGGFDWYYEADKADQRFKKACEEYRKMERTEIARFEMFAPTLVTVDDKEARRRTTEFLASHDVYGHADHAYRRTVVGG